MDTLTVSSFILNPLSILEFSVNRDFQYRDCQNSDPRSYLMIVCHYLYKAIYDNIL